MTQLMLVSEKTSQLVSLRKQFEEHGYDSLTACAGGEVQSLFSSMAHDVVIIDMSLSNMDGVQIIKKLRRNSGHFPIVMLSDRHSIDQRVAGLVEGADDYLTKPFKFSDLLLRIDTLLRRKRLPALTTLSFDDLSINLLTRTITVKGQEIHMPTRPFNLLAYLVKHQDEIVSREILARDVWSDESVVGKNVIEVYINQTRARFAELGHPLQLQTIRGKGYRLGRTPVTHSN